MTLTISKIKNEIGENYCQYSEGLINDIEFSFKINAIIANYLYQEKYIAEKKLCAINKVLPKI